MNGGKNLLPRIICASNPGNVGHSFIKRTWVDHKPFEVWQAPDIDGGLTRAFIPARLTDNPYLLKSDPDYFKRLEGLGDSLLVRAFLEGDWSGVADSMFSESWSCERHVIEPFEFSYAWQTWRSDDASLLLGGIQSGAGALQHQLALHLG